MECPAKPLHTGPPTATGHFVRLHLCLSVHVLRQPACPQAVYPAEQTNVTLPSAMQVKFVKKVAVPSPPPPAVVGPSHHLTITEKLLLKGADSLTMQPQSPARGCCQRLTVQQHAPRAGQWVLLCPSSLPCLTGNHVQCRCLSSRLLCPRHPRRLLRWLSDPTYHTCSQPPVMLSKPQQLHRVAQTTAGSAACTPLNHACAACWPICISAGSLDQFPMWCRSLSSRLLRPLHHRRQQVLRCISNRTPTPPHAHCRQALITSAAVSRRPVL